MVHTGETGVCLPCGGSVQHQILTVRPQFVCERQNKNQTKSFVTVCSNGQLTPWADAGAETRRVKIQNWRHVLSVKWRRAIYLSIYLSIYTYIHTFFAVIPQMMSNGDRIFYSLTINCIG